MLKTVDLFLSSCPKWINMVKKVKGLNTYINSVDYLLE